MTAPHFKSISIVGVGLIGGSFGLAIKKRFRHSRVIGFDKPSVLRRALQRKAIDAAASTLAEAAASDMVLLAMPINEIVRQLPWLAPHVSPDTIVTDVGSVKSEIVATAARIFPHGNFIGGHPMAGVELTGIDAAHPLLFENAVYVLTPVSTTHRDKLQRLADFLHALGARVMVLDAKVHDRVASAVSHLPQLTAVALMNVVGKKHEEAAKHLNLAAGGFRDLTRIASSKFDIWKDILQSNAVEIDAALKMFIEELESYRKSIKSQPDQLESEFTSSRALRIRIPKTMKGFLYPLSDIFVFVKDKPGQLAKITSLLGESELNIKDIEVVKVREGTGGTFRLSFANDAEKDFAKRILEKSGFEVAS
ncbi:MAG: prephenate dehydrogenase [Ignavibacteriales bacterium]|nr:prephenate dehydrogenase [Ignavibacteriales bacterium]